MGDKQLNSIGDQPQLGKPPEGKELNFIEIVGRAAEATLAAVATTGKKQSALEEMSQSVERLHEPFLEDGAVQLASKLAKSIVSGDLQTLQSLVNKNHSKPEWDDATRELGEHLEELGVFLTYDPKQKTLQILRPPSVWLKGPKGMALEVTVDEEKVKASNVTSNPNRRLEDTQLWSLTPSPVDASTHAQDLSGSLVAKLQDRRQSIESAKLSIKMSAALANRKEDGQLGDIDKEADLATAFLDKRLSPLIKAVRGARSEEERESLVKKLHDHVSSAGLFAEYTDGEVLVGCYAHGLADGYAVVVPTNPASAVRGVTGNHASWRNPDLIHTPAVLRIGKEKDEDVSAAKALREIIDRIASDDAARKQ